MDWNLKAASWDLTESDEETVPSIDAVNGSSSYKVPRNKWGFSDDLKLGQAGNAGEEPLNKWKEQPGVLKMESSPSKRARAANNGTQQVSCRVDECNSDLSEAKRYHRRHKVCEFHAKSAEVMMNGHKQRFCQQCSRFHSLGEFDEGKRSCRRRLAGHNMGQRKPQPDPLSRSGSYFSNNQAKMQSVLRASGSGLTELQGKEEEWAGKEIHLMDDEHKASELPKSPNCPSLIALYLQETYELTAIPPIFFLHIALLQVLDLSHTSIKSLPKSLPKLVSLKKLLLRGCELFMELSPQVGKLKNLEELDLDETQIMDLPREIGKLLNLRHLRVSFYHFCGKKKLKSSVLIHPETIANLSLLTELSIDVNPEDKRWDDSVEAVVKEVCSSKTLRTLSLYLPKFQLLDNTSLIYPSLSRFRFTVGHHKRRIISRVPHEVEAKFRNGDKCLKFVNGENIPIEIKGVLNYSTSFFLDHHSTATNLSEFGIENMKRLKFCLLAECNKMETLIDGEIHYERKKDDRSEYDPSSVEHVLEPLEYLSIYYMENLGSIWRGPNCYGCMSNLKFLALHTCPQLRNIFSHTLLENFLNLEEIILEDCPQVISLVSDASVKTSMSDKIFLPSLKRLLLLYLPELVSISNGLLIAPKLEIIGCYNCPKLKSVSKMELSSKALKIIKGECQWWEDMNWNEKEWGNRPDNLMRIFSPIDNEKDVMTQLAEDRDLLEATIENEGKQPDDGKLLEVSAQDHKGHCSGYAEESKTGTDVTTMSTSLLILPSTDPGLRKSEVSPHLYGMHHPKLPLPLEMEGEPIYVNAKQYHGILRRRLIRAKEKARKPFLHVSRHLQAIKRGRGCGDHFLNTKKLNDDVTSPTSEEGMNSHENLLTKFANDSKAERMWFTGRNFSA